jgi:small-conductance mechanosensitive channel
MNRARKIATTISLAVLVVFVVGSFMTRKVMESLPFLHAQKAGLAVPHGIVDQRPWQTAERLAALAVSAEELQFAREAERLADHEVDQAFAQSLRQASAATTELKGDALTLQRRVTELQRTLKDDDGRIAALTSKAGGDPAGEDLDVAKAQMGLDQEELSDAQEDLALQSGDQREKIQQELLARQAAMKKYEAQASGTSGQFAVVAAEQYNTLAGQISAWRAQRNRMQMIEQAATLARADVAALTDDHARLGAEAQAAEAKAAAAKAAGESNDVRVKDLQSLAEQRKILGILDDRLAAQQQLVTLYGQWGTQVEIQHKIVVHLMLRSLSWIAAIVLLTILAGWALQVALERISHDLRQRQMLRMVLNLGTQLIGLLLALLVIFGTPKQLPTILGLATAGLTVVFQDFILAFCGWFVLMRRHGIRVGDWVEIDGVGGEVVEVGLLRTTLLETGNWTANGHPTGRRVSFLNGFAIHGKYFNFSTAGQWMWDEIKVSIPPGEPGYALIEKIRDATVKATEEDVKMAELEWQRVRHEQGLAQFSAAPSIDMQPAAGGLDIVVRYVTRAGVRLETRNKLFKTVVELMMGERVVTEKTEAGA